MAECSSTASPQHVSNALLHSYRFCGHNLNIVTKYDDVMTVSHFVWKGGLHLCKYFENEKISFSGKKVIELGSGTGIVGILAVMLGGNVTLTDQLPVLHQIARNVTTNISPEQIHRAKVRELAWGKELKCYPSDFDFILGSDIIYSKISFPLLLQTLLHLSSQNTIIYLSSEMKYKFIVDEAYVNLLTKYFNSEIVSRDNELDINLYRMTKKCPDTEIPQLCK